jgi:hypothetical protein
LKALTDQEPQLQRGFGIAALEGAVRVGSSSETYEPTMQLEERERPGAVADLAVAHANAADHRELDAERAGGRARHRPIALARAGWLGVPGESRWGPGR